MYYSKKTNTPNGTEGSVFEKYAKPLPSRQPRAKTTGSAWKNYIFTDVMEPPKNEI
jgi:hypothetical protein